MSLPAMPPIPLTDAGLDLESDGPLVVRWTVTT